MASQYASHGRGGAGNMSDAKSSPKLKPSDLETPTLKKAIVTTGRGGTGNMAKNKDPVETRLRQDVRPIPRRYSSGAQHAGRGGAGNVFKDDAEELPHITSREQAVADDIERPETPSKLRKGWSFSKKA
ncbi:hypothetical protein MY11210_009569 [Beauveria gryllotalpidicola]